MVNPVGFAKKKKEKRKKNNIYYLHCLQIMLIVYKKVLQMKTYPIFASNNTHHASPRCTLWWVFDFYTFPLNTVHYAV